MTVTLAEFLSRLPSSPPLLITALLTLGVIFVNGWTDAPNAIATCVSTRALRPRAAVGMAAVCNLLGVLWTTVTRAAVAETICDMVDFGGDAHRALAALCAAMLAIVVWAVIAWYFGIPTSESHALIAGLSGAAIALQNGWAGINRSAWGAVLYGLVLTSVLGFVFGWAAAGLTVFFCRGCDRQRTTGFFQRAQIAGGAAMAFLHGAQDGQKFMGVFLLGLFLADGRTEMTPVFALPLWLMLLCSLLMAVGTSLGGGRIIRAVGRDMVQLESYQGFAVDLAAALCLLLSTLAGLPVSTTHTKTTAVMGVGAARRLSSVNWSVAREMAMAWVLTFPGCGVIGYLTARLFLAAF
ncbi:MAG: inorganic phosphate transporter [Clostridiales bacterium]|nr:inorganic phosphate transporter [Clostridiales bacterium]